MLVLRVEKRDEDLRKIKGAAAPKLEETRRPTFQGNHLPIQYNEAEVGETGDFLPIVKHPDRGV